MASTVQPPVAAIVGLGNPGPEYEPTRHNAGFWFVDQVARHYDVRFRDESKFHGELCRITISGRQVWLFKPTTYMNRSGQAVAALARFYKLPAASLLVAHDDLDLPPGTVRLKREGGHGGHNGLRDLVAQLGSSRLLRLRFGIGHPGRREDVIPYVLSRPKPDDRERIDEAIACAVDALPLIVAGELEKAMQRLHSRKTPGDE